MLKRLLAISLYFVLASLLCIPVLSAQNKKTFSISGTVTGTEGEPVIMATFVTGEGAATITDLDGNFLLEGLMPGTVTYTVSSMGYADVKGQLEIKADVKGLKIILPVLSLGLDEVVVTAEVKGSGSSSKIGEEAIRHIQPMSVTDMFQLLPGGLSTNPNLASAGQASIREISSDANNAMGTSVMVDGAPLSNDGNMQALSTSMSGNRLTQSMNGLAGQGTAGGGVDLRSVSPENIASMEVIRGIPSAEYGNLTSGVVILKTKAGATPWSVKFKADPYSKMAFAGKGFSLKKGGAVNAGIDLTRSFNDPRKKYLGYDRLTFTVGYSRNFTCAGRPLYFRVNGNFYTNINTSKTDPQMQITSSTFKSGNTGGRLNLETSWKLNGKALSSLDFNFMASQSFQKDEIHDFIAATSASVSNAMESGTHEAVFLPTSYYADYFIDGRPLNLYLQLKANKIFSFGQLGSTNLKAGMDWRYDRNFGRGLVYDIQMPPQNVTSQALRPRSLKDVPALNNLAGFIENRLNLKLGPSQLVLQTGIRMTGLFIDRERGNRGNMFVPEPRFNLEYTFFDFPLGSLGLTAGWGLSFKTPNLLYLYPDNAYFDRVSLAKRSETDPSANLALTTTEVLKDLANPELKPARNRKVEAGLNFRLGPVRGNVNWFMEKQTDEFGYSSQPHFMHYRFYDVPSHVTDLEFKDNEVLYTDAEGNRLTAPSHQEDYIATWMQPANKNRTDKMGVEYTLDFGSIRPIRTSLVVDGAWFRINRVSDATYLSKPEENSHIAALMPSGRGSVQNRVNTNFRFITHIPAVKMVFSTTVQVVWYESVREFWKDEDGKDCFVPDPSDEGFNVTYPLGVYDAAGNWTEWQDGFEDRPEYSRLSDTRRNYRWELETIRPWVMVNFRLTKEIGKMLELSFTANNFTNSSRWHRYSTKPGYRQIYPPLYFGAELKLNIGK